MCNFLSAIVDRTGKIYCLPEYTDSHTDLIAHYGLRGDTVENPIQHFARLEYLPKGASYGDLDSYELKVDEPMVPSWFDEEMRYQVTENLRARVKRMLVDDERAILLGGCWILLKNSKISEAKGCRIVRMEGGTLTTMEGGTLTTMRGGTLTTMRGGTLTTMRGGTLTTMEGGTLTTMEGGTLTTMRGGTLTTKGKFAKVNPS